MKRRIRHTCGHTLTHDIRGTPEEREKRFRWLGRTVCTDCWRDNRQFEAELDARIHALPPLQGSPAQIRWAERIRADRLGDVYRIWFDTRLAQGATDPVANLLTMDEALAHLARPTGAGWWIDRRDHDTCELLRLLVSAAMGL